MAVDSVRIRFCSWNDISSKLIEARENAASPFAPAHCELVASGGYVGAEIDGGVKVRPIGWDETKGITDECFVDVPCNSAAAMAYAESKVGAAYDWPAIIDYALPVDLHWPGDFICSALMAMTLAAGNAYQKLAVQPHLISPRDLLLILSALVAI